MPHKKIIAPQPVTGRPEPTTNIEDLIALMARLRADCPWDIKQTNHSLIPYAIEEAYELAEAIQEGDIEDIKGELGDVLLQVIFHCQIYAEQHQFDLDEVVYTLQSKLIRRHPHVFEADNLPDETAVKKRWDEIKALENAERERRGKPKRSLDKVKAGSALIQAQSLQKSASKLGFDWDGVAGAIEKLEEEIAELKQILPKENEKVDDTLKLELEKELGDCVFGLVNVARKLNLDAEAATLTCVHKFRSRFGFIEDELAKQGKTAETSSLEEMDALWEQAKQHE
ncbi:nucleoside triphosphate pyrophosphohydrolase [Psychrobacter sanguinis]|uniref:nucleoside triphosphate pyrophosphohydrolase n=1 Tax=Psychrobacter sanguinis TaxID=861445 RepID=UPI00020C97A6|nr:nucleoside triphosphate pyrophosphohydrolase [Psychrobacter sanguinis]EGK14030.1 nucleoside triphosphate pyrophosphohydrolase [Psychrobacter sp. 1501(2011)]MCD9150563.1 nucleoside triphosphate pyrophosphohydrolase [Psychrobacter sanguinis]